LGGGRLGNRVRNGDTSEISTLGLRCDLAEATSQKRQEEASKRKPGKALHLKEMVKLSLKANIDKTYGKRKMLIFSAKKGE